MNEFEQIKHALRAHGERQIKASRSARRRAAQAWGEVMPFAEAIISHAERGVPFVVDEGIYALLAATAHEQSARLRLLEVACIERTLLGQRAVFAPARYGCTPPAGSVH